MKILVTGGAGFIGSHVVDAYLAAGHHVAVVDTLTTGRRAHVNPAARLYEVDIRDPRLREAFERERPDVVNHHAAQASVVASVADPRADAETNLIGTLHVLMLCAQYRVRRIVFASTGGAIYGDPPRLPAGEDDPANPLSPYGISKLAGEFYVRYFQSVGLTWAILRYANVYGPRQDPHGEAGVVAIFARAMLTGLAPTIFGDGTQTRDFVFVEDIARASLLATGVPSSALVNIGTGTQTSVNDIFRHLAALTGFTGEPLRAAARPGEVHHIAVDPSRAAQWLGWTPTTPLLDGLRKTVEWCRSTR
jgi:UDP-glucose 4-epimerase